MFSGKDIYDKLVYELGGDRQATEKLSSLGIPGNTHGGVSRGGTGAKYVIWDQATLDRIAMLERNGQALDQIMDEQDGVPPRLTKEQMEANSVRLQKAKKLKDSDIEQILVDRYGRGNIRSAWKASGEKDYTKWRKAEAEKMAERQPDAGIAESVISSSRKFSEIEVDEFNRVKPKNRVGKAIMKVATDLSRPVFIADSLGIEKPFMDVSTKATDQSGKMMAFAKKWRDKAKEVGSRIAKGTPVVLEVKTGGPIDKDGVRSTKVRMTKTEALNYYLLIKRAEMEAQVDGKEGRAKTLEHALGRFVMGEKAEGDTGKVFFISKEERAKFKAAMESDPDVVKATAQIEEAMNKSYDAINEQYRDMYGVDLERDAFYFHMVRDVSFLTKYVPANAEPELKNAFNLFKQGDMLRGFSPESLGALKDINWSDAPIMIRNAYDQTESHFNNVAKYLETSPVKEWVDRNILNQTVMTELGKSEQGRRALEYYRNMSDTIGGAIHRELTGIDKILKVVIGNATVTRLASPWVMAKQVMSMPSALTHFGYDPKYISTMFGTVDKDFIGKVLEENGTLAGRRASKEYSALFPEYTGEGSGAEITGAYNSKLAWLQSKSGKLTRTMMGAGDNFAINRIIMMAKKYVETNNPELTGKAFLQEVGRQAAYATKKTQVATYGIDRTLQERNVQGAMDRMIVYMWGARGAQANLLFHSMSKAFSEKNADAYKAAGMTFLAAGLAQSGGVVLLDMIRDGLRDDDDEPEDMILKAQKFGVGVFESIAGTVPVASDFLPAVTGPIYKAMGDKDAAATRKYRLSRTGPVSSAIMDVSKLIDFGMEFATTGRKLEEATTQKARDRILEESNNRIKSTGKSALRLLSEGFGIPVNQVTSLYELID
jgi:hypothetical protein